MDRGALVARCARDCGPTIHPQHILPQAVMTRGSHKALEAQVKAGRVRSIGVSNFEEAHLLDILNNAEIKPSVLQIELHAFSQQKTLRDLCAIHGIVVTSHTTLGSTGTIDYSSECDSLARRKLLEHPTIAKIAENHKKSTAQVLLRHAVQNGIVVIPKSTNPKRIKENIDLFDFELTDDQMKEMNGLDKGERGRFFDYTHFKGWWG